MEKETEWGYGETRGRAREGGICVRECRVKAREGATAVCETGGRLVRIASRSNESHSFGLRVGSGATNSAIMWTW